MAKFKTLGLPPEKLRRFIREFFEILGKRKSKVLIREMQKVLKDRRYKDQCDKSLLIIALFIKYGLITGQ